jgi:predicted MFS family arabinose efflux permease
MILANLLRALLIALVPLSAMLGLLRTPELVVIAFAAGTCTAMYEVCWLSYVPSLVRRTQLIDAMGKVSASHSAAETAGPAVGGALVQVLTAPFALVVDAISYLVGAASLLAVRQREPDRVVIGTPRRVVPELVEGLKFTFGQPCIRATAFCAALGNFFSLITETVFLPYAVRELHLAPALVGLTLSAMGIGGLIGAVTAYRIIRRFALGRVYVVARSVSAAGTLLLPLATGSKLVTVAVCMASFFVWQAALASTNVINSSLRQALTPEKLRGRMNASVRTLVFGALPLGGLTGGVLGSYLGLHNTLWIGAAGFATSLLPILLSPLPRLRSLPD